MIRFALVIAVVFTGCKPETGRKAERAAKDVAEQREDLKAAASETPTNVAAEAKELSQAAKLFTERKRIRIAALRGEHSVVGTQVRLISTMAEHFPLTDAGRADINNALTKFQRQLDEARNHIEGLEGLGPDEWTERDDAVQDAMDELDNVRRAAWRALEDAPRVHRDAS
jgi:hypothetical protein